MKLFVPLLVIALVVLGVLAFWKFGMNPNGPAQQLTSHTSSTVSTNVSKQAPITGNPDDINSTVNQAAQNEGNVINSNDESSVVNQNNTAAGAVGDSYDENSF